jgi:hypothetical protein
MKCNNLLTNKIEESINPHKFERKVSVVGQQFTFDAKGINKEEIKSKERG